MRVFIELDYDHEARQWLAVLSSHSAEGRRVVLTGDVDAIVLRSNARAIFDPTAWHDADDPAPLAELPDGAARYDSDTKR